MDGEDGVTHTYGGIAYETDGTRAHLTWKSCWTSSSAGGLC
jgi:hypothetical protein